MSNKMEATIKGTDRAMKVDIENAHIGGGVWRNFRGEKGVYNKNGDRYFNLFLDPDVADVLSEVGLPVKVREPRPEYEDDEVLLFMKVKVRYRDEGSKGSNPQVILVSSKGQTLLKEDELAILDWADIEKADVIINPYYWSFVQNGEELSGVSAYLDKIWITIRESPLDMKYADVPMAEVDVSEEWIEGSPF